MKRLLTALLMIFFITTASAQNITTAEYFFDEDPGCGNGTALAISSPGITVNFPANIPTNTLSAGFHSLAIRVRTADGIWSFSDRRGLYISTGTTNTTNITAAEYFFDTDPGKGNGTPVPVGASGATVNFTAMIPASLSAGFHFLCIRTKDAEGKWGFFESRGFFIRPATDNMPVITAAEYFYDNDPGAGNGTSLTISAPGNIVAQSFMIPVPAAMSAGDHLLAIRVKDQWGNWSLFEKDTLTVDNIATITCPGNITVNASAGQCTAIVNSIDPTVAPPGSSFTYTLTGATTGSGNGTASGHIFNAGTTTVTYALSSSPATNCSFIVTVNTNVVPSVSIVASQTTTCSGTQVTFTATPANGGTPSYQWKLNGNNAGTNNTTYQNSSLQNGDSVWVVMTSSIGCANPSAVASNKIIMTVSSGVVPSVNITASSTDICGGTQVTFTATPAGGGATPSYQWKLNGTNIGTNSPTYQISTLYDGDRVSVVMTSSLACANPSTATSNSIMIGVTAPSVPSVSISASATTICPGAPVTFTAMTFNGGFSPTYQWKLNGNNVGTNSPTYQNSALQNGDSVKVIMTSSMTCVTQSTATSNSITIAVGQTALASVSITASETTICSGTEIIFTATPVNEGSSPSYQWKLNGNNVGTNSATYQNSALQNGDSVKVVMTSSLSCVNQQTVTSNSIALTVGQTVIPSVIIAASANPVCSGVPVTFTATPTNGGNNPHYLWRVNGNGVGDDSPTYQTSTLQNGDSVEVIMGSALTCATQPLVLSNSIHITTTGQSVPSVTITASDPSVCSGTLVTFTATPVNGGAPSYQWKLNGNNVGTNSATYQSSTLANNDTVKVIMTSSLSCASQPTVTSNSIIMWVGQTVTPSVSIAASATTICSGEQVTFTATPVNGGSLFNSATPVGIGPPAYQWKLNGNNVGTNSATYQSSTLANSDVVTVVMTSGFPCASPATVSSNAITITVTSLSTFYRDLDGDGYGNSNSGTTRACTAPAGYVSNDTDCNDNNAAINPGHAEVCGNGIDDNCNGTVDENCTTNLPVLTLRTYPIKEGDAGQTVLNVTVTLDAAASAPVSLNYTTTDEDATAGLDYVATRGVLVIPAGSLSGTIQVRIIGDLLREANERFRVNFTNPVNVIINDDPFSRIMIIDDDKGKNNSITSTDKVPAENEQLKIPSVSRRNEVWLIHQIGNYENEVSILNTQGQIVTRFINYRNQTPLGNLPIGLYFYRVQLKQVNGQSKYYTGRLMITE